MTTFEHRLIALVRLNDCLFSTGSRTYKNIVKRQLIWLKISQKIGKPVDECKQRWKSLRDRYVRETRKKEVTFGSADEDHQDWELYSSLGFLREVMKPRKQLGKFEKASFNESNDSFMDLFNEELIQSPPNKKPRRDSVVYSCTEESVQILQTTKEEDSLNSDGFVEQSEELQQSLPIQKPYSGCDTLNSDSFMGQTAEELLQKPPTEITRGEDDSFKIFLNSLSERLTERFEDYSEMDDNDMFMKTLAVKMKHLPQESKIHLQEKFLKDVNKEMLKYKNVYS